MQILAGGHERRVPIGIQTGTRIGQARTPAFPRSHRPCIQSLRWHHGPWRAQHIVPIRPVGQPVGAIHLILVEQVGQLRRQLVAAAQQRIVLQKTAQRCKDLLMQQAGQHPHQPPGQQVLAKRRPLGHGIIAQHGPVRLPDEARGKLDVQRSRDTQPVAQTGRPGRSPCRGRTRRPRPGIIHPVWRPVVRPGRRVGRQRQRQPLGDAVALDQNDFVFQGRQRMRPHPVAQQVAQRFGLVAMNDDEASGQIAVGGLRHSILSRPVAGLAKGTVRVQ